MKIGILSRNPSLYSTRRLAHAIWARGHHVQVIDTTAVAVHIGGRRDPARRGALAIGSRRSGDA